MKLIMIVSAASLALAAAGAPALAKPAPKPYAGHELASKAKVTMAKAEAIALTARPGRVSAKELENEGGGSGLRYSFDIVSAGATYEVGVDASTGKVLENAREGAHPD